MVWNELSSLKEDSSSSQQICFVKLNKQFSGNNVSGKLGLFCSLLCCKPIVGFSHLPYYGLEGRLSQGGSLNHTTKAISIYDSDKHVSPR